MKIHFFAGLVFFVCVLMACAETAPLFNGGFEDTTIFGGDTLPAGWQFNQGSALVPGIRKLAHDACEGNFAVSIWNWYGSIPGRLVNGKTKAGGEPVTMAPAWTSGVTSGAYFLVGCYKYLPGDNSGRADVALAEVILTRYDTTTSKRDTVAYGLDSLKPVDFFSRFGVNIQAKDPYNEPDTVRIQFLSSKSGQCNSWDCLYLYLDDLSLQWDRFANSERGTLQSYPPLIFPNPARSAVTITIPNSQLASSAFLYDLRGRALRRASEAKSGKLFINLRGLPDGIYLIMVSAEGKKYASKLLVQK